MAMTASCLPFRFLFRGGHAKAKKKAVEEKGPKCPPESDATAESFNSSSSSIGSLIRETPAAQVGGEEHKSPDGNVVVEMVKEPVGPRFICGYEILDSLGKGMSGKVKKGRCQATGRIVALKVIDKAKTPRRVLMLLTTEIQAMKALTHHPNILCLLGYDLQAMYPRKEGGMRDVVCLALELASGGELFDFMMYTGSFGEEISKAIFLQLASALAFCHERGIYHRDIKPENLLLDHNYQLKVADFGLAAIRADPTEFLRTECGTRSYMAPEVLARQQYHGSKADCWSAGVVLFIMLSGNPPFQMARPGDWWFNQFRDDRPDKFWRSHRRYTPNFPDGAADMLTRVFSPDPAMRPKVKDLLSEPWLTSCTMTPLDLKNDFLSRKEKILKEKGNEKDRARRKKASDQVLPNHQGEFDPEKVKHRDVPGLMGGVQVVDLSLEEVVGAKPPVVSEEEASGCWTSLYTGSSGRCCVKRVRESLLLMGAEMLSRPWEEEQGYRIQAIVSTELMGGVEVEVRVGTLEEEEEMRVIQVVRRRGDLLAFHQVFRRLRRELADLTGEEREEERGCVGPQPADSDEESGDNPRPDAATSESEELILDPQAVEMI